MNRELTTRQVFAPSPAPRARGLALAMSALVFLTMFALQLTSIIRSAWQSVLQVGPASPDQLLAALAGSVALGLIVWLLGAVLLSVLAALGSHRSALSRAAANGARLVAPLVLRNAIAALLGVAIAAVPSVADAATRNDDISARTPAAQSSQSVQVPMDQELSPAWVPVPDNASTSAAARPTAQPTRKTRPSATFSLGPVRPTTPTHPTAPAPTHLATTGSTTASGSTANPVTPQATADQPARDLDLRPGWLPSRPPAARRPSAASRPPAPGHPSSTAAHLAPPAPGRRAQVDVPDEIVVHRGDTLWDIAARHLGPAATDGEIAMEWPDWFAVNRAVIGNDPDHLAPGERLRAPEGGRTRTGRRSTGSSTTRGESR